MSHQPSPNQTKTTIVKRAGYYRVDAGQVNIKTTKKTVLIDKDEVDGTSKYQTTKKTIIEREFEILNISQEMTVPISIDIIPSKSTRANSLKCSTQKKPGFAYIYNQEIFDKELLVTERHGTAADVKSLSAVFAEFKLEVKICENYSLVEIRKSIEEMQQKNYTNHACVVICILSHGSSCDMVCARDKKFKIMDTMIHPLLQNATLANIPKIFIVQACKGPRQVPNAVRDQSESGPPTYFVRFDSTFEGYTSYRFLGIGTPFIQAFCENLSKYGHDENLREIMERVIKDVENISLEHPDTTLQVPTITYNLTERFVLGDYV